MRPISAMKLLTRLANIGDAKSLAARPASTTHRQLSPEELIKAGVTEDTIPLSIGIERIDDLIADLDRRWPRPEFAPAAPARRW